MNWKKNCNLNFARDVCNWKLNYFYKIFLNRKYTLSIAALTNRVDSLIYFTRNRLSIFSNLMRKDRETLIENKKNLIKKNRYTLHRSWAQNKILQIWIIRIFSYGWQSSTSVTRLYRERWKGSEGLLVCNFLEKNVEYSMTDNDGSGGSPIIFESVIT